MAADELVAELSTESTVAPPRRGGRVAQSVPDAPRIGLVTRAKITVVRTFLWGWARLFSLRGLYWLGQAFGTCEWCVDYRRRGRLRQRIREILGADTPASVVRRTVWRHFMRTRCDKLAYLIFDKLPREKILRRVRFHGRDKLDAALARGKGAAVVLAHSGPHHMAFLLMALLGYRLVAIRDRKESTARRYVLQKLQDSFAEFRTVRWFFADVYPRELYRSLGDGYILSGALDVSSDRGGRASTTTVRIFGRDHAFRNGTMRLAFRCGAPILQGFITSRRNYYYRLVVTDPIVDPDQTDDANDVIDAAMQHYADHVEDHVRRYPCQLSRF